MFIVGISCSGSIVRNGNTVILWHGTNDKLVIALEVVQSARNGDGATSTSDTTVDPPRGRFLTKDTSSSVLGAHGSHWWIEVEETKAIAKTSRVLRDW